MANHLEIRYSIILVPFPFDDFSSTKVRPALCLTPSLGNYSHIVIAFISSVIPEALLESDILIVSNSESNIGTGLKTDSVIRLHKIVSIPQNSISRKLGKLNSQLEIEVKLKLLNMFALKVQ